MMPFAPGADAPLDQLALCAGSHCDWRALAPFHYLAGDPAKPVRIVCARDICEPGAPVGVLVVSMPTLNSAVRERAWPGRYRTAEKRVDARRVNREIRTISRVVVDPRWRGLGVARRLVRAYLNDPLTPRTEAIAAMGCLCPFFERAGMRPHALGPDARDARLARVLATLGVKAWRLIDVDQARQCARNSAVVDALRRWANASRATRDLVTGDPAILASLAGLRLSAERRGYTAACAL